MGAPQAEAWAAAHEQQDFEVMPAAWVAVRLFLAVGTQWRFRPDGSFAGLDIPAIESAMRLLRVPAAQRAQRLGEVQTMEAAALKILNTRH